LLGDPADGTIGGIVESDAGLFVDVPQVVGFVFDAGAVTLYRNGEVLASSVANGAIPATLYDSSVDAVIGGYLVSGALNDRFTGQIGEVVVSDSEIDLEAVQLNQMSNFGILASELKRIQPATILDFDARVLGSYNGAGQEWTDLVSGKTFFLGEDDSVSTDDPTFTGTAGDSGAYFALDGGDLFNADASTAALEAFRKAHRTDASYPYTFVWKGRYGSLSSGFVWLLSTFSPNITSGWGIQINNTNGNVILWQGGDSATELSGVGHAVASNTEFTLAIQFDMSTNTVNVAFNGSVFSSVSWASETATTDASDDVVLGALSNFGSYLPNGSRIEHFSAYNKLLSDAELSNVLDIINNNR